MDDTADGKRPMRQAEQSGESNSVKAGTRRIANAALAAALALALGAAPLAALADDAATATSDAAAETATTGASDAADATASSTSSTATTIAHGLQAAASETVFKNGEAVTATDAGACGLFAENGGTIVANALDVQTKGDEGAAVATSTSGGGISVANSQLATAGTGAPLLFSAGTVEADNVTGTAEKSGIARVENQGTLLIDGSTLSSADTGTTTSDPIASAITIYGTETTDATTTQGKAALFQANGASLASGLGTGALFYLTNTTATIVLADTTLSFDADKVQLLSAAGSDAASDIVSNTTTATSASTWGTAGKNGATVTFTGVDQQLEGDITVDSISSLDLYLLDGSTWTGSSSITANAAGASLASNIIVNIDATSGWVVTENATVSTLNIEKGGSLVDESGKAVTIVDADGNKLVDGASDVKVSVIDEFSTTVKTTAANQLQSSAIDRTVFDAEYGTSTAFGTNGDDSALSDEEYAAALAALITAWFYGL